MSNLLQDMGGEWRDVIERFVQRSHVHRVPPRDVVIHAGDHGDEVYYIIRGSVSISAVDDDGRELILAYLGPGQFFGEMGMFDGGRRSAEVVARQDCQLAKMSYSAFQEHVEQNPRIMFVVAKQLSQRLNKMSLRMMGLAFLSVAGRIAQALIDLSRQPDAITHPDGMQLRITRQELAKIVGCSREMAGRVLKELQAEGLIHARGKTVVVYGMR